MTCSLSDQELQGLFEVFRRDKPDPRTELEYGNAFQLLVAVVLSAQMTDRGVNKATQGLFQVMKTPADGVALGEEGLAPYLAGINYHRTKTKNVVGLSRILVEKHSGEVPHDRQAPESLPGVGHKTASVVLNAVFGDPVIAVDTHVHRVSNRIGLSDGKVPLEVEKDLMEAIPSQFLVNAHHWLILHGRYVCLARKPLCRLCPVAQFCRFEGKNL